MQPGALDSLFSSYPTSGR